jgi:hypothetical protein
MQRASVDDAMYCAPAARLHRTCIEPISRLHQTYIEPTARLPPIRIDSAARVHPAIVDAAARIKVANALPQPQCSSPVGAMVAMGIK